MKKTFSLLNKLGVYCLFWMTNIFGKTKESVALIPYLSKNRMLIHLVNLRFSINAKKYNDNLNHKSQVLGSENITYLYMLRKVWAWMAGILNWGCRNTLK
jgi:hypothetical protein